jgi:hypothetical protein
VKRSHSIALALLGSASAAAVGGCSRSGGPVRISPDCVYVNDYYVPGVGYYHAPFHAFYSEPYNAYNAMTHRYFYGGVWSATPNASEINISSPTAAAADFAEANRTDVVRGGFGSYGGSGYHYYGG